MQKVFISHSSKDKEYVLKLVSLIGTENCILDVKNFEDGLPVFDEIHKGLQSTDIFVLLLSDASLDSEWVKREQNKARYLFEMDKIKRFHPYIIDNKINHFDNRIDPWIKSYILNRVFDNPFMLSRKVKQSLREIIFSLNTALKERASLFVGRNDKIEELETRYYESTSEQKKMIAVSGFEGVGRRRFLEHVLSTKIFDKNIVDPIYIVLEPKESVEDFILKLNDATLLFSNKYILDSLKESKNKKIEIAINLIRNIVDNQEILFIKDNGSIILAENRKITGWFIDILYDLNFPKSLCIFIISTIRPALNLEKNFNEIIHVHIDTLKRRDQKKLLIKYAALRNINIPDEDVEDVLDKLTGLPEQVYKFVDFINSIGLTLAKNKINEIVEIGDKQAKMFIDFFIRDKEYMNVLILLSKFEFISFDVLYQILDNKKIDKIIEEFVVRSSIEIFGPSKEYIKLNNIISDYLKRNKFKLDENIESKVKQFILEYFSENDKYKFRDLSMFLFGIRDILTKGGKLAEKYFIPSFVLKSIIDLYYKKRYRQVIELSEKILYDSNKYYLEIIEEIRYWRCLSLCREQNESFFKEVANFRGANKEFLFGFYYRIGKEFPKAEAYFKKALDTNPGMPKARREMVEALLGQFKYPEALKFARQNYVERPTNTYHIEAYFKCLVRKYNKTPEDIDILKNLINEMHQSHDPKSFDIVNTMKADFRFHVKKDVAGSISALQDIVKSSKNLQYPVRTLKEIYDKQGNTVAGHELTKKYKEVFEGHPNEDDDFDHAI